MNSAKKPRAAAGKSLLLIGLLVPAQMAHTRGAHAAAGRFPPLVSPAALGAVWHHCGEGGSHQVLQTDPRAIPVCRCPGGRFDAPSSEFQVLRRMGLQPNCPVPPRTGNVTCRTGQFRRGVTG